MGYPTSVLHKINAIMGRLKRVEKDLFIKTNAKGGGYHAIGSDQIMSKLHAQFRKEGLVLNVMTVEGKTTLDTGMSTKSGAKIVFFEGVWDVVVSDIETGDMIISRQVNSDMDSGGMAATKAQTKAIKKALLTMFMLGAGENEEEREEIAVETISAEQRIELFELCDTLGLDRQWLESLAIAKNWGDSTKIPALGFEYCHRRLAEKAEEIVREAETPAPTD